MFNSSHEIWKYAYMGDELNDWLPYAEDLVKKWSKQSSDEVQFEDTFQIILASLLLADDLLPASARKAFARLTLDVISETDKDRKFSSALHIKPSKPGRKENLEWKFWVIRHVRSLINEGSSKSAAYSEIAEQQHKSPDTIRRLYERAMKKI